MACISHALCASIGTLRVPVSSGAIMISSWVSSDQQCVLAEWLRRVSATLLRQTGSSQWSAVIDCRYARLLASECRASVSRLANLRYAFDTLGRTTALPAVDAHGFGTHTGSSFLSMVGVLPVGA